MKHKSTKYYKARADRLFSLWVRQRDAGGNEVCGCITCGIFHSWRSMHCGHFMSRRHESTRYHEDNAHAQCVHCNTYDQGKQFEHGQAIDELHRKKSITDATIVSADTLCMLSKRSCKRVWFDYMVIGNELLEDLKANNFITR